MTTRHALIALAALPVLALSACGASDESSTSKPSLPDMAAMKHEAVPNATVAFVVPKTGSTLGRTIHVKLKLKNFKLDPAAVGKAPKPGHGHLHFSLDDGRYDYPRYSGPNGKIAARLGVEGKYSPSVTPTITYCHIPAGKHTLEVYLANNNHTSTGVEAKATVNVR